jgi:transcriptional antiterminator NusG
MKRWYVVQVYAGHEETVKTDLERRIQEEDVQDLFGQVLVPTARMQGIFNVGEEQQDEQLFPGYVLVEMELAPQSMRLVLSSPRAIKFLGGKDPAPLSKKEADRVLSQVRGDVVVASKKSDFVEGSEIDIVDGPFAGFVGIIEKIDEEDEKLTVMVSIFGRMTPVELSFNQVKR